MEPIDQNYDGIPKDAEERDFTGIWIPAEIWLDDKINGHERLLYAEIASFGSRGCWKKSEELMKLLGVGRDSFQRTCRNLRERGYISEKRMFGRIVRTSTLTFQSSTEKTHQTENQADEQSENQADEQSENQADEKVYTKEYTIVKGEKNKKEPVENSEHGRADINELVTLWENETGISIKGQQRQRCQLYNLLQKHGRDKTIQIIELVGEAARSGDRFAPMVTLPSDLTGQYEKLSKLDMWKTRKSIARPFGNNRPIPAPKMATAPLKQKMPNYGGAFEQQSDTEHQKVSEMMREARQKMAKKVH